MAGAGFGGLSVILIVMGSMVLLFGLFILFVIKNATKKPTTNEHKYKAEKEQSISHDER